MLPFICVAAFLSYLYFGPLIIGNDIRYDLFIVALPTIAGLVVLCFFMNKLLDKGAVAATKKIWYKFAASILVLAFASTLISYCILGILANIIFEAINYNVASGNKAYEVVLPVDKFTEGSKSKYRIYFTFNNKSEYLSTSRKNIQIYKAHPQLYRHIKLTLREGVWNHYLVERGEVIK